MEQISLMQNQPLNAARRNPSWGHGREFACASFMAVDLVLTPRVGSFDQHTLAIPMESITVSFFAVVSLLSATSGVPAGVFFMHLLIS